MPRLARKQSNGLGTVPQAVGRFNTSTYVPYSSKSNQPMCPIELSTGSNYTLDKSTSNFRLAQSSTEQ